MIVQIYEVNNPPEAQHIAECGVDHIGVLIGKEDFSREVSIEQAREIFDSLPKDKKRVALSLSNELEYIAEILKNVKPDILHLGAALELLSPHDVQILKNNFPLLKIMRSIPVTGQEAIKVAQEYDGIADYLLLDSHNPGDKQIGALGKTHDWSISKRIVTLVKTPVILAGGLGPDNVSDAIQTVQPAGVDSKTKTDRSDGNGKDIEKVKEFVRIAKSL
jgi:phosphoribosylanthranilate isomerase